MKPENVLTGFLLLLGTVILVVGGPFVVSGVMAGFGVLIFLLSHFHSSQPTVESVKGELGETPSVTRYHIPSLLLIAVGVAIVLLAVVWIPHPFDVPSRYEVHPGGTPDDNLNWGVYNYSELSPEGKDAFRAALRASGKQVILYGERAPEFQYLWDYPSSYIIYYNGSAYTLETFSMGGLLPRWVVFVPLVATGSLAIVVGGLSLRDERPFAPTMFLVGLGGVWVAHQTSWALGSPYGSPLRVLVLVVLPVVGTWVILKRRWTF